MGTLIVVKHAAPRMQPGVPAARWSLSEAGLRQCHDLAARLAASGDDLALYASEEPKARETAAAVARELGTGWQTRVGLQESERASLPFFDDRADFDARIRELFARPTERVIGRESADEAHARFLAATRAVIADAGARTPVVIAHGTVITLLVARANQLEPFAFWRDFELTAFAVLATPGLALRRVSQPGAEPAPAS